LNKKTKISSNTYYSEFVGVIEFENSARLILELNRQIVRCVVLSRTSVFLRVGRIREPRQRGDLYHKNSVRRFLHGYLYIERSCVRTHGECMLMRMHGVCTRWVHLLSAQWTVENCLTPYIFTMYRASCFSHTGNMRFSLPAIYLLGHNKRHVNHVKPRRLFSIRSLFSKKNEYFLQV